MIIVKNDGTAVLQQGVVEKPIVRWKVWYTCPFGLCADLKIITEKVLGCDLPLMVIKPVAVAFTEDDDYEVVV
jgi:hypothetical protein